MLCLCGDYFSENDVVPHHKILCIALFHDKEIVCVYNFFHTEGASYV